MGLAVFARLPGTPNNHLFQLDDSESLHKKWLFHQTSIYKWLFRVPGSFQLSKRSLVICFVLPKSPKSCFQGLTSINFVKPDFST